MLTATAERGRVGPGRRRDGLDGARRTSANDTRCRVSVWVCAAAGGSSSRPLGMHCAP